MNEYGENRLLNGFIIDILILLISLLVLIRASHIAINNSVKVADTTGFGKTTIGFLLVAFSTSLPELLVSIFAILSGEAAGIAIGNIFGSNITNVCLILGACIVLVCTGKSKAWCMIPIFAKEETGSLYFGIFMASIIPLVLLYIREASNVVGAILFALFIFNTYQLFKEKKSPKEEVSTVYKKKILRYLAWALLGIAGVIVSAYFLVESASNIALSIGIPNVVIGATIVAFGTSIPELATSMIAVRQGHIGLAFGNIIGSGFINLTCILGVTLLFSSFTVNMAAFTDIVLFSLISNLLIWYFISSERIGRQEGTILLVFYFIFLIITFGGYRI